MIYSQLEYEQELEWLFTQFPSYQTVGGKAYKPGLDTMKEFDSRLGSPHKYFKTIHVAGTNGKGSISHMLAAGLSACGYKVGLYTSPHLIDFRERIKICKNSEYEMISKEEVFKFINKWKSFFIDYKPSFFEITTGMAFDYFRLENVDIAVIETGLGGRLDSTNIITPILSVITNIGLEHCEHLGNTLQEIAGEKGGIIKKNIPVVIGETVPETLGVFKKIAVACESKLYLAEEETEFSIDLLKSDLKGEYQNYNLRTVFCAFKAMSSNNLISLSWSRFLEGISIVTSSTGLRGRWETLCDNPKVICDTGHNAHGIRWVSSQLEHIRDNYDNIYFIFGIVADKDIDAIAHCLPKNVEYIFTNANSARALKSSVLAKRLECYGFKGEVTSSVATAVDLALNKASSRDLIFIGGSNYVIAELLSFAAADVRFKKS
ncbi:MAG: bifunctional folylpolyglutamate synthase/dihydrofolate synthase [Bacteroidales bacterium]|nr:bifunctional folylpolyglutamate synthase/dihydrofolate synthase [Bacteroidales bacterium]